MRTIAGRDIRDTQSALLQALAASACDFADASHWVAGANALIARLGGATGVSRVWVFQTIAVTDDDVLQDYVFEWACAPHYYQANEQRFRFFRTHHGGDSNYTRLIAERAAGHRHVVIPEKLPMGNLRRFLESQGIRSMATVPIMRHEQWWGTLGIDDCERAIDWPQEVLDMLTIAAELLAGRLYRHELDAKSRQLQVLESAADYGAWDLDLNSGQLWCSQTLLAVLGYPPNHPRVPVRRLLRALERDHRSAVMERMRRCAHTHSRCRMDVRIHHADGNSSWRELIIEVTRDTRGQPTSLSGLVVDISARKAAEAELQGAAHTDSLTGVFNRRGFIKAFDENDGEYTRTPETATDYLVMLDIDEFKTINDRYGHAAGDALLQLLCLRIETELRDEDIIARLSGDEFVVLLRGIDAGIATRIAERIRAQVMAESFAMQPPGMATDVNFNATVSIGAAPVPALEDSARRRELGLAQADRALYSAKNGGRNRAIIFEMDDSANSTATPPPTRRANSD